MTQAPALRLDIGRALDGFDGQFIGFAIPLIIPERGVCKAAFAPAIATGLIGVAVISAGAH